MALGRREVNATLLIIAIFFAGGVAWLAGSPLVRVKAPGSTRSFGMYEGRCLTEVTDDTGRRTLEVRDSMGEYLFTLPLRNCMVDFRYRDGLLRYRDLATRAEGYLDTCGYLAFDGIPAPTAADTAASDGCVMPSPRYDERPVEIVRHSPSSMTGAHPFAREAAKVLSGRLEVADSTSRHRILEFCEQLRLSYTQRDIEFLRRVLSDNALIIVGRVVRETPGPHGHSQRVEYLRPDKLQYLERMARIFSSNKRINVQYSDFSIMRHPSVEGIYGVSLDQVYASDLYSDHGRLFLLWDFRDPAAPKIHVRTWQPATSSDESIGMADFNLE